MKTKICNCIKRYLIEYNNDFGKCKQTYIDAKNSQQARKIFYEKYHNSVIVYTQKV